MPIAAEWRHPMTSRPLPTYHLGVSASDLQVLPDASLRTPGVEPGPQAWEACMIPLHYARLPKILAEKNVRTSILDAAWQGNTDPAMIA